MIYNNDCTLPKEYLEQLTAEGLESLPEMIRVLVNEAMQIERSKYLNAKPYQRSHECLCGTQVSAVQVSRAAEKLDEVLEAWRNRPPGEVAEDIRAISNMPDREAAETYLKKTVEKYALITPKLADWMEVNIPAADCSRVEPIFTQEFRDRACVHAVIIGRKLPHGAIDISHEPLCGIIWKWPGNAEPMKMPAA